MNPFNSTQQIICALLCFISTHLSSYPSLPHEELFIPHPENIEQVEPATIAIGCVFRSEASWLKEWIEYHLLIGVDHFYLYNNCSTDDYLDVLLPYIRRGIVELFDFPKQDWSNFDQGYMYNHTLALAQISTQWLAIIDTDEFINPFNSRNLPDYLKQHEDASSIYIRWQIFGTSEVTALNPGELLIEKLIYRAPDGDATSETWGKSIYQTQKTISIDSAHFGSHPPDGYRHLPHPDEIKVNHYMFRTIDFLYNVKFPRTKVWKAGNLFPSPESLINYLPIANSTRDETIQRYVILLKKKCFDPPNLEGVQTLRFGRISGSFEPLFDFKLPGLYQLPYTTPVI